MYECLLHCTAHIANGYSRNDCILLQDSKSIVFNMVVEKQTLTITTYLERLEIKNCWWLVIKVFAVLGLGYNYFGNNPKLGLGISLIQYSSP